MNNPKLAQILDDEKRWDNDTTPKLKAAADAYLKQVADIRATRPHDEEVVNIAKALADGRDAYADKQTAALFTDIEGTEQRILMVGGVDDKPLGLDENPDWIEVVIPRIQASDYKRLRNTHWGDDDYLTNVVYFTMYPRSEPASRPDSPTIGWTQYLEYLEEEPHSTSTMQAGDVV
jgi:hypothetical protein